MSVAGGNGGDRQGTRRPVGARVRDRVVGAVSPRRSKGGRDGLLVGHAGCIAVRFSGGICMRENRRNGHGYG